MAREAEKWLEAGIVASGSERWAMDELKDEHGGVEEGSIACKNHTLSEHELDSKDQTSPYNIDLDGDKGIDLSGDEGPQHELDPTDDVLMDATDFDDGGTGAHEEESRWGVQRGARDGVQNNSNSKNKDLLMPKHMKKK
ncbi:hypothetical protein B0A55_02295 [Friedmanniomyces simplex]|uniref:Uncharacterized protein n=1 Tax=Friedmanniomyces simplex TaxID=329884 RepID=A0A4U0Y4R9_9PEZI|nr:hypothetical protein B0A55_02295 [Friedmanniomyces simplex]